MAILAQENEPFWLKPGLRDFLFPACGDQWPQRGSHPWRGLLLMRMAWRLFEKFLEALDSHIDVYVVSLPAPEPPRLLKASGLPLLYLESA